MPKTKEISQNDESLSEERYKELLEAETELKRLRSKPEKRESEELTKDDFKHAKTAKVPQNEATGLSNAVTEPSLEDDNCPECGSSLEHGTEKCPYCGVEPLEWD